MRCPQLLGAVVKDDAVTLGGVYHTRIGRRQAMFGTSTARIGAKAIVQAAPSRKMVEDTVGQGAATDVTVAHKHDRDLRLLAGLRGARRSSCIKYPLLSGAQGFGASAQCVRGDR